MKKLGLIGVVILGCAGCGHGWLPFRRGATCQENCVHYAHDDCVGCAGYPSYSNDGVVSEPYYGPAAPQQPMSNLPPGR